VEFDGSVTVSATKENGSDEVIGTNEKSTNSPCNLSHTIFFISFVSDELVTLAHQNLFIY